MLKIVIFLTYLLSPTSPAPVRTELCCCGCTEEPCPLVGPNCPAPRAPCNTSSVEKVQCSALQRLFEISQHHMFIESEDSSTSTAGHSDEQNSPPLLPTLEISTDNKKMNKTQKAEIRLSPRARPDQMNGLHRISHMMSEMEGMLQLMRDELNTQIDRANPLQLLEEAATRTEVDSSLHASPALLSRAARVKRAATDNCNDEKLRKLVKDNIKSDAKSSKREIQKAANKQFGGHFNVICSPCEFSFVVASQKYCDGFKDGVACFAFLQPPTKLKLDEE
uniref:Ground-like domain-containing protein n=1 Tax=Caenorhabditis japonica TaxID=281687 RepID=A0A8R1HU80_CAEJA